MEELKNQIRKIVYEEYERALKAYGQNHSQHEGYAVLLEEIEEAEDEIVQIRSLQEEIWSGVKDNSSCLCGRLATHIESGAINLACEAVQVAAMARKFRALEGENE